MFLLNFNQRWRTGSTITLLDSYITQVSFQAAYIAGSAKCSTKSLSKILTCILSAVKTGFQSYCDISYSRGGVNQMWILKNSKDLLEYIQSRSLSFGNSIETFDFSILYTTILHSKLKDRWGELVQLRFITMDDHTLILPKSCLKLISSICSSFWFMTYLLCLVDVFFNGMSTYLWVQTVLLFSPTCSFIRTRHTSYRGFSRKTIF
jgi:hypothetical protein